MKVFFRAVILVLAFFIGLGMYHQETNAGEPSTSHSASANSGGASASTSASIGHPWTEGESYTGHGNAVAGLSASTGDFFGSDSASSRGAYDDCQVSVTIESYTFLGVVILYESSSGPSASVSAYSGEYVDSSSAYTSGYVYMSSTTEASDYWPD